MEINLEDNYGFKIIRISGHIEQLKDSIFLKSLINSLVEEKKYKIAICLKDVEYIDSSAINIFIYTKSLLEKHSGVFCIIEPNEYILDVLSVVGVEELFFIYNSIEELKKNK